MLADCVVHDTVWIFCWVQLNKSSPDFRFYTWREVVDEIDVFRFIGALNVLPPGWY